MLDTYNQQIHDDVSCTIRTNINTANLHFIVEEVMIYEQDKNTSSNEAGVHRTGMGGGVYDGSYPTSKTRRGRVQDGGNICPTITCNCEGLRRVEPIICAMRGRTPDTPTNGKYQQRIEMKPDGTSNTLTGVQKDNLVLEPNVLTPKRTEFGKKVRKKYENKEINMSRHDMTTMEPRNDGISNTLTSVQKDNLLVEPRYRIRKLTPRECFRLMGVDDEDIDKLMNASISNSQLYKCAGNSIVVDTLYHLFRKMFCEKQNESQQPTLF